MKIKIKTIELQPDKYGKFIKITKIGLYDNEGKWIRWVKLNDELIKFLTDKFIEL